MTFTLPRLREDPKLCRKMDAGMLSWFASQPGQVSATSNSTPAADEFVAQFCRDLRKLTVAQAVVNRAVQLI